VRAAIGAIVDRQGGPVANGELEALAARAELPWRGSPRWFSGQGCGLFWIPTIPGAAPPPAGGSPDPRGGPAAADRFAVVVDGTLDNRPELAKQLGLPPAAATPGSEPLLVAAACERWGAGCPEHLIGEFAFLTWDRRERRLLAARDAFGSRELFFGNVGEQLRIGSQAGMIRGRPSLSDLDEEYVADFLSCQDAWGPATPFQGIRRLEVAHQLTLADGRLETHRFWHPRIEQLRYRTDEEYAEHFLAVFREAVERCLATGGRVWSDLSGGMDSSSIVATATAILSAEPARARDFATVTHVWKDTPQSDERELAQAVAERHHVVNHLVWCDDLFFGDVEEECRCRNDPHFGLLAQPMLRAITDLLRASGVTGLMMGTRSEASVLPFPMFPLYLADLVRDLRLPTFVRELWRWQRGTHQPLANLLGSSVLLPLFGGRRYFRPAGVDPRPDPWLDQRFVRRMQLEDRARRSRADKRFRRVSQQQLYEIALRTEQGMARGRLEWMCEVRHPFIYRPLVELGLAIPWERQVGPDLGKLVLRRALADRLPEPILRRRVGSGPGPAMYKTFAKRWPEIEPVIASSLLVSLGYIDGAEFHRTAEQVCFGATERFADFLTCLAFEYWLRTTTGCGQEAGQQAPARARAQAP
jgi:asparagine synthase (glutamine-hydrolysing)